MTDLVTIDEVKEHLQIDSGDTDHDASLTGYIDAATAAVEEALNGPVLEQTFTETISPTSNVVLLNRSPVTGITSVQSWSGGSSSTLAAASGPGGVGYLLNGSTLTIGSTSLGAATYVVTYTAGYETVPPTVRLVALELIALWWAPQQTQAAALTGDEPEPVTGLTARMLTMLRPYAQPRTTIA